jgi:uncharacterized protein YndB with AHSA1/START domain
MKITDEPIVVEQTFNKSIDIVWDSITKINQMRQWYFENIPSFKPKVGFETQFNVQSQDRNFLHLWKVTEVVPKKLIAYNWKYDGYTGDSFVQFELFKEKNCTRLKLTHHIKESFPEYIPEFRRASGIEGWTFFIKNSLKGFLEKSKYGVSNS